MQDYKDIAKGKSTKEHRSTGYREYRTRNNKLQSEIALLYLQRHKPAEIHHIYAVTAYSNS
jgi:hypothetical protein